MKKIDISKSKNDPLGLELDTKDYSGPLEDWKVISMLNLSFDQIVKLYGQPPKEAMKWFV